MPNATAPAALELTAKRYCGAVFSKATEQDGQKLYSFKFTTASLDRDGEVITLDGWEFDSYLKNPIILDSHDYFTGIEAIVGHCVAIRKLTDGWECDIAFSQSPKGQLAQQLVEEGSLRAVSVGFKPIDIVRETGQPPKHVKKELLEISVVPIPSNRDALRTRGATMAATPAFHFAWLAPTTETAKTIALGKAPDFNTTLAQVSIGEDRWKLYHSLTETLDGILADENLEPEAKLPAADTSLGQFHALMLRLFGQALGIAEQGAAETQTLTAEPAKSEDDPATKAGRTLSAKNEQTIRNACDDMRKAIAALEGMLPMGDEDEPKSGESTAETTDAVPDTAKNDSPDPEAPPAAVEAPESKQVAPDEGGVATLACDPARLAALVAFANGGNAQ